MVKQKIIGAIRYFEYLFSITGIIVAVAIYYYWKIYGPEELLKAMLGYIIYAALIIPFVTLLVKWKTKN